MMSSLNRWNQTQNPLTNRDPFFRLFDTFLNQDGAG